jgi:hypothetical protein
MEQVIEAQNGLMLIVLLQMLFNRHLKPANGSRNTLCNLFKMQIHLYNGNENSIFELQTIERAFYIPRQLDS